MPRYLSIWRFFVLPRHVRQCCEIDSQVWRVFNAWGPR